jgi:phosphoglycerol transferase MdoB-like AlkP superfamily enzyme
VATAGEKPALGATPPALATSLQRFGADVLLVFVESYGAVTYERSELASVVAPSRDGLAVAARAAGREVLSAFVYSPTFGASSWLAHLTLLTGVEVTDQYAYAALMTEPRDTLAKSFKRSGYRSVAVMPGMRQAWPEGSFYGFDRIYGEDDLRYLGPAFGWWGIPDQFAMARFDDVELDTPRDRPVFAVFPTSTTHAPFGPVAPYLPDWSRVLRPDAFESEDAARAIANPPDLTNLGPSYARAMAYEFEVFAGYVREHAGDDQVLILIGDHQPASAVSGPDASNTVPVHVVTSRPEVVEVLLARGFVRGVTPRQPAIGRMHGLVPVFFEAFGASHTGRAPAGRAN